MPSREGDSGGRLMKLPEPKHTIAAKIDEWYEKQNQGTRYHYGCSMAGHHCERYLWATFRWVKDEKFPGRMLRLFERGQNEEAQVVKWLRNVGCVVRNTEDDQLFVDLGSHLGGSVDGIIDSGVPGAEKTPHVLEIKTSSKKAFEDLRKKGCKDSKPQHYAQQQLYMYATGITRSLYVCVCKDNDELHIERIEFDPEYAEGLIERSHRIATQDELPPPLSEDPSWWKCKFCHLHGFCHGEEKIENRNCRTCRYSSALDDGSWFCVYHNGPIAQEYQQEGCKAWELHDDLEVNK
jgi:CRISPR/Cas system-associated exonuclease Cas4 (RecB family)